MHFVYVCRQSSMFGRIFIDLGLFFQQVFSLEKTFLSTVRDEQKKALLKMSYAEHSDNACIQMSRENY